MTPPATTGFAVDPAEVQQLGAQVGRAGKAAGVIGTRLTGGPNDWGEGGGLSMFGGVVLPLLLEPAREAINELQRIGMENTTKAASLGEAAGTALVSVGTIYADKDAKWRAEFDRTYRENHTPGKVDPGGVVIRADGSKPFTDVANPYEDPRHWKETPGMEHPGGELWAENWGVKAYREADKILEKASVAAYIRELATRICGTDPFNQLVILIGGLGYELLGDQAIAFRDAGYSFESIKKNIDQGRFEIQERWTGHVADEALAWLERYSACCRQHAEFLGRAGARLMNLARLLYNAFEVINRCLDFLIEQLIKADLLGDVVVGVKNIFQGENPLAVIGAVVSNFLKLSDAIDAAHVIVQGFQSLGEVIAATDPVPAAAWPAEPYRVPEGMTK